MTNEQLHEFRKQIDACINVCDAEIVPGAVMMPYVREMDLAKVKLQEAKMWVGKCLEMNGSPFPPDLADKADQLNPPPPYATPATNATNVNPDPKA